MSRGRDSRLSDWKRRRIVTLRRVLDREGVA